MRLLPLAAIALLAVAFAPSPVQAAPLLGESADCQGPVDTNCDWTMCMPEEECTTYNCDAYVEVKGTPYVEPDQCVRPVSFAKDTLACLEVNLGNPWWCLYLPAS